MAPSVPAEGPNAAAAHMVPYGNYDSFPKIPFPEWNGSKSVMYRSADGKRVAGTFRETESAKMTYPCDEFTYVKAGWVKAEVEGGDTFTLYEGDCVYFTKGTTVTFSSSEDYCNVSCFFAHEGDGPVSLV
ncbi:hypothetical protein N7493_006536 [Penicillium malachiteum]|uniref:(S)-ureidoglycine aminohydrolase cupin domain-containing protein n=1 Tax=Penicillium malachiteum TaxID=1324776 RepID=A0AAD6HLH3_9EURO|nr:hypothetical protein N7493_006536 [Penicillium malachiteum]